MSTASGHREKQRQIGRGEREWQEQRDTEREKTNPGGKPGRKEGP